MIEDEVFIDMYHYYMIDGILRLGSSGNLSSYNKA